MLTAIPTERIVGDWPFGLVEEVFRVFSPEGTEVACVSTREEAEQHAAVCRGTFERRVCVEIDWVLKEVKADATE